MLIRKKDHTFDGLEAFVKIRIGLPLTEEEQNLYDKFDDIEKKIVFDFIDNDNFKEFFDNIVCNIHEKQKIKKK